MRMSIESTMNLMNYTIRSFNLKERMLRRRRTKIKRRKIN